MYENNKLDYFLCKMIAQEPKHSVSFKTCSICFKKGYNMVKCTHCDTVFHLSCIILWSKNNIGVPEVFRCPFCFNLLKINREIVKNLIMEFEVHKIRYVALLEEDIFEN